MVSKPGGLRYARVLMNEEMRRVILRAHSTEHNSARVMVKLLREVGYYVKNVKWYVENVGEYCKECALRRERDPVIKISDVYCKKKHNSGEQCLKEKCWSQRRYKEGTNASLRGDCGFENEGEEKWVDEQQSYLTSANELQLSLTLQKQANHSKNMMQGGQIPPQRKSRRSSKRNCTQLL
jgi:N-acetylmuramoyl-L-alanine amidase CwlA